MTETAGSTANGTSFSARQVLADWANGQDAWVRVVVAEVVSTRQPLTQAAIDRAYDMLLLEKELLSGPPVDVAQIQVGAPEDGNGEDLRLNEMSDVIGVNALLAGQTLSLNDGLTVVFGENASGKTGYVRILKRLAGVRSAERILEDIRRVSPQNAPSAKVRYSIGGQQRLLDWKNEAGVEPLNRLGVFDAPAVAIHVDDDLSYVYTPGDIALFRHTHDAIETIKSTLEGEMRGTQPRGNPFLVRFRRGTSVYPKIEALGPSTSIAEIRTLANSAPSNGDELTELRDKVEALRPESVDSRLQLARSERELLLAANAVAKAMQTFDWNAYNNSIIIAETARRRYLEATESAFVGEPIPAAFTDAWRNFIEAGEDYLVVAGLDEYPAGHNRCIYCQQELRGEAASLLLKYRAFTNNKLKQDLQNAEEQIRERARKLSSPEIMTLQSRLDDKSATDPDEKRATPVVARSRDLLQAVRDVQEEISAGSALDLSAAQKLAQEVQGLAGNALDATEELIASLERRAEERRAAFEEASAQLQDVEDRITLRTLLPDILSHVEKAVWANRAATICSSRFPTLLRSLTEASKVASERLLNQDFERLFRRECEALRAPQVQLFFPGRQGAARRRKVLSPDHKLSEILSEGEQNVIALADFLAESALRTASAPLVFDDPVSSLDYRRLDQVVDRIAGLVNQHQVVVFTHNIWFATQLLARFEKTKEKCTFYEISATEQGFGQVIAASHPRWDTVARLKGKINSAIQAAEAAEGETRAALIEKGYDLIRAWCEVVVETELFRGVTQRFSPHVAMTKLEQINYANLKVAVDVILPGYERACRVMGGHSQPLETLGTQPTLSDLKTEWQGLEEARSSYLE